MSQFCFEASSGHCKELRTQNTRQSMSDYVQKSIDVSERAAQLGFDWPDASSALEKVSEEVIELRQAIETNIDIIGELGDLWFALINVTRKLELRPEDVLTGATSKFESRFRFVESQLTQNPDASLEEMEKWWQKAKDLEK